MTITQENGSMTARLTGEIDHHTAAYLRHAIDASFVRIRPDRLILDFSGVQAQLLGACIFIAKACGRDDLHRVPVDGQSIPGDPDHQIVQDTLNINGIQ